MEVNSSPTWDPLSHSLPIRPGSMLPLWLLALNTYIARTSSSEISNLKTFLSPMMDTWSSLTLDLLKFSMKEGLSPSAELQNILPPKSSWIKVMERLLTGGLWECSFMKCTLESILSTMRTQWESTKTFSEARFHSPVHLTKMPSH